MTSKEYNQTVDQFSDAVFRFMIKNMKHRENAEDATQHAFEVLWKNHEQVEASKAKAYLFTVAYHYMIDQFRKKNRYSELGEGHEEIAGTSHQYTGTKEALEIAVKKLPHVQRSVLMLRDYEGYSYEEIGGIMNLNESQVKVYIFRARQTLKNYFIKVDNAL